MLSSFFSLFSAPKNVSYDSNHPAFLAMQANDLSKLQNLCRRDPDILKADFQTTRWETRYMGGGNTSIGNKTVYKTLLNLAIQADKEEVALWLIQHCTDKAEFTSSVMKGRKGLVEAFCKNPNFSANIAENASYLFEDWQLYRNFEIRQGYVRVGQIEKHPCPLAIFSILFSYMSLNQIEQLIERMENEKNAKIIELQRPSSHNNDSSLTQNAIAAIELAFTSVRTDLQPLITTKRNEQQRDQILNDALEEVMLTPSRRP